MTDGCQPGPSQERLREAFSRFPGIEKDPSSGERREFHRRALDHFGEDGGRESPGAQQARLPILDTLL